MDNDFPEPPVSTMQVGATPIQYKTPQPVPEEFASFDNSFVPPKRYIIYESKQDILEEIAVFVDPEVFVDSCQTMDYNDEITDCIPQDAFKPPELDMGNIGDLDTISNHDIEQAQQHKFQESKMPMHAPTGKYHIMELFWFLNPNYLSNLDSIPLEQAHFCTISFNIDFGNMKITFYKVPNGALEGHKIYLMKCQRMTSVSIYPSSLFKLIKSDTDFKSSVTLHASQTSGPKKVTVTCMEQLIFKTNESWQQERPMAIFETDMNVTLTIKDPKNGDFHYVFQNWQKDALIHSANFVINQGLVLTGYNNILGNRVG